MVEFIERIKFAELELRGIEDLVGVGMTGSAFHIDGAYKEIRQSSEGEQHIRTGRR